jgi:hypothetical protein
MTTDPWTWIAAILTLAIFSFLYKDNPLYKVAEHLFVGISAGYYLAIYFHNNIRPNLLEPVFSQGQLITIFPLVLGLMYFARFIPKIPYLIRWPIAFLLGVGSGLSVPATFQARIIRQIQGTIVGTLQPGNTGAFINSLIILIGVLFCLTYFFFSKEQKGALKVTSRVGIVFLMIGFGASFGYTVMARVSLLIGRFQFLLSDWLGIISY